MYVALASGGGAFAPITLALDAFGASPNHGGWSSNDEYPRVLADVNGDGAADIIGFGQDGVYLAQASEFDIMV